MMKHLRLRTCILSSLLALHFVLLLNQSVFSQAGTLDSSFNGTGSLPDAGSYGTFTVQPDGKILSATCLFNQPNNRRIVQLNRFNSNAAPDNSFGLNGTVFMDLDADALRIKVYPDGNIILLAGSSDSFFIFKRQPDGKPDLSFGNNGKRTLLFFTPKVAIKDVELQPNGKILLAGGESYGQYNSDQSFFMTRLNADGSTDIDFGNAGVVNTVFNVHYDIPDDGNYHIDIAAINDIQLQADGKIVAVGGVAVWDNFGSNDSIAVVRYNSDGQEDTVFAVNGRLTLVPVPSVTEGYQSYAASGRSLLIQPDGKLVIGASCYYQPSHGVWFYSYLNVTRLNSDGKLDTSFSQDGMAFTRAAPYRNFIKMALQADNKLFVGTTTGTGRDAELSNYLVLTRLLPDGNTDTSFGPNSFPFYSPDNGYTNDYLSGMELSGSRIYAAGLFGKNGIALVAFKNNGLNLNPKTVSLCSTTSATTITADVQGLHYQWQQSTDSINFYNINENENYSGVNTTTLQLDNISAAWNGFQFRCIADSVAGNVTTIHLSGTNEAEWTGAVSSAWENPANWLCGQVPGSTTDVIIGRAAVAINSNVVVHSLQVKPGASVKVNTGFTLQVLN